MTHFLYLIRHAHAEPHDGPLSAAGREQARLTGLRLRDVPLAAIYHGPLERAAQTASIIASSLPGVTASASDLVSDYIPADPDLSGLPGAFAEFVRGYDAGERAQTVIAYRPASPPSLLVFNDGGHLPERLRWTGFPAKLRPA